MNAPNTNEATALAVADSPFAVGTPMDAASLILGPAFERVQTFAAMMCKGMVTVPQHLRGNPGDCMAVTLAALSRRMDPFAFAQKTHITKSGALGYESQLIDAMITVSGAVDGKAEFEFLGDWSKVLGKVEEKTSDKGGKYYVAKYTKADEDGLGVIVRRRLRGERVPRELTVMLSQCYPRFSTQWATDPKQQICYVANRKFARLYCPETILGVNDVDELEPQEPKFMGPADVVQPTGATGSTGATGTEKADTPPEWSDAELAKREGKIAEFYGKGKTADDIIAFYGQKGKLTEKQKQRIRDLKPKDGAAATPAADQAQDVKPKVTFATVAEALKLAKNEDEADAAATLIGEIADAQQRVELTESYEARVAELRGE